MLPQACNNTFLRQYQKTQLTTKDQMRAKGASNRLILWAKGADQSQSARNWAIDCELQKLFLQRPSGNLTWIAFTCDRFLCQTWVKQVLVSQNQSQNILNLMKTILCRGKVRNCFQRQRNPTFVNTFHIHRVLQTNPGSAYNLCCL